MATSETAAKPARSGTRPGTYFLSLTVENVRCFGPAQTLDLSDGHRRHAPWTIILGENGLGKTTLLTCLACVASMRYPFSAARHTWESIGTRKGLVRLGSRAGGIVGALLVSSDQSHKTAKVRIELPKGVFTGGVTGQRLLSYHYGASRRMPQRKGLTRDDERVGVFLDDDVALRDPEDWLLTADYNAHLRGPDAERFGAFARRVREALVEILPEVSDIRIQPADEPGESPRVEARTPDGWMSLRRLGFGYQSQLTWLVDFASRMFEHYPDSLNPLTEPAVVLVDEIDLHMHPRWQRQVIGYLTGLCPGFAVGGERAGIDERFQDVVEGRGKACAYRWKRSWRGQPTARIGLGFEI